MLTMISYSAMLIFFVEEMRGGHVYLFAFLGKEKQECQYVSRSLRSTRRSRVFRVQGSSRGLPGVFRVQAGVQGSRGLDASRHSKQKSRTSHWSICFGGLSGISLLPYFDVQVLLTYM